MYPTVGINALGTSPNKDFGAGYKSVSELMTLMETIRFLGQTNCNNTNRYVASINEGNPWMFVTVLLPEKVNRLYQCGRATDRMLPSV